MAAWCIDLAIVVVVSSIVGWFTVSVLGWPDVTGWILAAILAFSYWPVMNLLKRTPGQLIMATRGDKLGGPLNRYSTTQPL